MRAKFLALFFSVLLSANLFAQYGGGGFFFKAWNHFTVAPVMNANFTGVNNTLPANVFVLGGGGFSVIKGFIVGGRGFGGGFVKALDNPDVDGTYSFGGGEFNFGRTVYYNKSLFSYVYLGLGGYVYGVDFKNLSDQNVDLGSVVLYKGMNASFDFGSFTVSGGLAVNFLFFKGFELGLDFSYHYSTKKDFQSVMLGLTVGGFGLGMSNYK